MMAAHMRAAYLVLLTACAGKAPGIAGEPDAATTIDAPAADAAVTVDAAPVATGEKLTGKAYDYFTNAIVATAMVSTDGLTPALTATTGADGAYELDNISPGSKLYVSAIRMNYKSTKNIQTAVAGVDVMQDIFLLGGPDIKRQYTTAGLTQDATKGIAVAELRMMDGTVLTGVPLANIKLLDAANAPVTVGGVYFIGAAGDVDKTLTVSTTETYPAGTTPRARVALLGVPAGAYTLSVTYTPPAGADVTLTQSLTVAADSATLIRTGGTTTSTTSTNPTFEKDIWPRLQTAAKGGLGCANCHTAGGQGAVLKYDDPAATVLTNMKAITGVIDLTTPANSLLLVRPLYEAPPTPQDHPNATFADINDPDYKLFLLWITQGAKP